MYVSKLTPDEALTKLLKRCVLGGVECHIWPGATSGFGYPVANIHGVFTYLHRAIYLKFKGAIPDGYRVDHICNTTRCLNPDHLRAISHGENVARGGAGYPSKYDFRELARLKSLGWSDAKIGEHLGVTRSAIQSMRSRRGISKQG